MDPRVQVVIKLMTEDLRREFASGELARAVNVSPSRLRHLFKRETGTSITRYLKARRMAKAKEVLETTFLNVNEVMQRVGVKDKSHFSRDFKKYYGLPPLKYRNKHLTKSKALSSAQP
jgi:transcriptional regulator GlxA family with amidase domain